MKNILIVGCGRLGSALYRMLSAQENLHTTVYDTAGYREEDKDFLPEEHFYSRLTPQRIRKADIIFISVPDDHISDAARALQPFALEGKIVLHTSGLHSAEIIRFLEEKGASSGSLHPVQTFNRRFSDTDVWKGIWCTFEGADPAASVLEIICAHSGARFRRVNAHQKKALHIAAVFAANFSGALFAAAEKILHEAQLDTPLIDPLIRQMQENFRQHSAHQILSGPLQRGDTETVSAHLKFLTENGFEKEKKLYKELSQYILSDSGFDVRNRETIGKALRQT